MSSPVENQNPYRVAADVDVARAAASRPTLFRAVVLPSLLRGMATLVVWSGGVALLAVWLFYPGKLLEQVVTGAIAVGVMLSVSAVVNGIRQRLPIWQNADPVRSLSPPPAESEPHD